ncbi:hypothetical protein Esi_0052_0195 [Ectocarpus siliculosus]|uniref:Uncharacterized protein n=1 Tax=Ectocarpus siliculosus TaxID=2880 RepID=D8LPM5_ECTSI|nr:hypothetical protein Esi_0052_0195 [Ectocarpus siliculosus]|eukprot:CBN80497.1 hypothetical protein Esi_0052_0195 [Ectocarpus siliculosus]
MVALRWERRHPRIPAKLRIAAEDAVTKPPEIKSTVVRSAFAAISSRFPDLQVFVGAHGLGISQATLREMVGRARSKRSNWRARGKDLPLRVMRDTLWVEDVMWALRVRKTRREFDKWEINEYRDEWVSILEAATPNNHTVFAPPPDHRIAPPLSFTELLQQDSSSLPSVLSANPGGSSASVSNGGGGGTGSHLTSQSRGGRNDRSGSTGTGNSSERRIGGAGGGREGMEGRRGRGGAAAAAGGGSMGSVTRPVSTGKMWTPLESRLPTSLLLTSRPGSAAAAVGGTGAGAGGDLATTTGGTPTVVTGGNEWGGEGGAEDPTVWNFSSWTNGGGSGGANGHGSCEEGHVVTAQERALFGRKPSPATVARSTSYAPRRRPPCSTDGRRHRPEVGSGDDTAELYEMERDINTSSFALADATDLSITAASHKRGRGDGRSAVRAWGSVATSALTFDDAAGLSHANAEASADSATETSDRIDASASGGGRLRRASGTVTAGATAAAGVKRIGVPTFELSCPEDNDDQDDTGGGRQGEREGEGHGRNGGGEGGAGSAAEWWCEALGPTSRRPVTRRSLDHSGGVAGRGAPQGTGGTWGPWEEDPGGGCGQHERSGCGWTSDGTVQGGEGYRGGRRRASAAAPNCGFSTESKQRNLEDFLKRRSSMDKSEGLASERVRVWEAGLARAQSGTRFRHQIGRGTIRENYDQSLRDKACETLALDLRGYGTHLLAPETATTIPTAGGGASERCASASGAGVAATGTPTRAMKRAWSSTRIGGGNAGGGGGRSSGGVRLLLPSPTGAGADCSKPPPFGPVRGTTVQEARITAVTHQAGMWGKCSQGHFGRFEEKPYVHSFSQHLGGFLYDTKRSPREERWGVVSRHEAALLAE